MASKRLFSARRPMSTLVSDTPLSPLLRLVDAGPVGRKAVASQPLVPGQVLTTFKAPIEAEPTMYTVCLDDNVHVSPNRGTEYISHACGHTNTRIDVERVSDSEIQASFVVTKPVEENGHLCFNYNSTEWELSCPFECACEACLESGVTAQVRGFKHLSVEGRAKLLHEVSPFVHAKNVAELGAFARRVSDVDFAAREPRKLDAESNGGSSRDVVQSQP